MVQNQTYGLDLDAMVGLISLKGFLPAWVCELVIGINIQTLTSSNIFSSFKLSCRRKSTICLIESEPGTQENWIFSKTFFLYR